MASNTLFNYIELHLLQETSTIAHCEKIELDQNKDAHQYYRFELAHHEPVILKKNSQAYTLRDHHISVYETENKSNPNLSQYHYTAYFSNSQGSIFRLHVYFNANDDLTMLPVFSEEKEETFVPVNAEVFEDLFIQQALDNVKPVISALRGNHSNTIKRLEEQYEKLEKELSELFKKKEENPLDYLNKLDAICATLNGLIPLVRHDNYKNTRNFFFKIKQAMTIDEEPDQSSTQENAPPAAAPQPASETNSPTEEEKTKSTTTSSRRKSQPQPRATRSKLEIELEQLTFEFNALKQVAPVQAIKLEDILARTYELSLQLEQKCQTPVAGLIQLQNLRRDIQQFGEKALPTLLFNKQFALAKQLTSWHYLLNRKYLNLALQTRNHELLDFVLTHGDFNLNNQPVTVKEKSYPSAVHACFSCDSNTFSMSSCLSVLIKHGASILVNDDNGLPLAYPMIQSTGHPLEKALIDNKDKTVNSVPFFKQLRNLLTNYLSQGKITTELRKAIIDKVDYCNARIDYLNHPQFKMPSGKNLQDAMERFQEKNLGNIMDQINNDPDISKLKSRISAASKALFRVLPRHQVTQYQRETTDLLDNLDKLFELLDIQITDFSKIKNQVMESLKERLILITTKTDLLALQQRIARNPYVRGKKQKALIKQEKDLIKTMLELESKFGMTLNTKALQTMKKEEKKLDDELKSLDLAMKNLTTVQKGLSDLTKVMSAFSSLFDMLPSEQNNSQENPSETDKKSEKKGEAKLLSQFSSLFNKLSSITDEPFLPAIDEEAEEAEEVDKAEGNRGCKQG